MNPSKKEVKIMNRLRPGHTVELKRIFCAAIALFMLFATTVPALRAAAAGSGDLSNFTSSASLGPEDAVTVVDGGKLKLMPGVDYVLDLEFEEREDSQFDDTSMTMQLPGTFISKGVHGSFNMDLGSGVSVRGNTYTVDNDNKLTVAWNSSDPNYDDLIAAGNAKFKLTFTGMYEGEEEETYNFGRAHTLTVLPEETAKLTVEKSHAKNPKHSGLAGIRYDSALNSYVLDYTVDITSTGKTYNVVLDDAITENVNNAASLIPGTISLKDADGNAIDSSRYEISAADSDSFTVNIGYINHGETLTLTYSCIIDVDKLPSDAYNVGIKGVEGQDIKNTVTAEGRNYVGDNAQGDTDNDNVGPVHYIPKLAKNGTQADNNKVWWDISGENISKLAGASGRTITDTLPDTSDRGGHDVRYNQWEPLYLYIRSFEDSRKIHQVTIPWDSEYLTLYDANGDVVTLPEKGSAGYDSAVKSIVYNDVRSWALNVDSSLENIIRSREGTVPPEHEGDVNIDRNYWSDSQIDGIVHYTIRCCTLVDPQDINNPTVSDYHGAKVPFFVYNNVVDSVIGDDKPGTGVELVTPEGDDVTTLDKYAETYDRAGAQWNLTLHNVPAAGLQPPVDSDPDNASVLLVDYLPRREIDGTTYYDTFVDSSVEGLLENERMEAVSDTENHLVKFVFYYDDGGVEKSGLAPGDSSRDVVITVNTQNDPEWVQKAVTEDDRMHLNEVVYCDGQLKGGDYFYTPMENSVDKTVGNYDRNGRPLAGQYLYIFEYNVDVTGMTGPFELDDTFDSDLIYYEDDDHRPSAVKLEPGEDGSFTESTETGTVTKIGTNTTSPIKLAVDPPADDKSVVYPACRVKYYLALYSDQPTLQDLASKQEDLKVSYENTAVTPQGSDTAVVEEAYNKVDKALTDRSGSEADYKIEINPNGLELNGGEDMTLTDEFSRTLAVKYDTVSVKVYDNKNDMNEDTEAEAAVRWDYSGNTGTFRVPDGKYVVVSYKARIVGVGELTLENTASLLGQTKTVEQNVTIDNSGSGSADNLSVKLFKYKAGNMTKGLEGAKFRLETADAGSDVWTPLSSGESDGLFTTDADGYVEIKGNQSQLGWVLWPTSSGKQYRLVEDTPPAGYQLKTTKYIFGISPDGQPDYDNYVYVNGDILKVSNKPVHGTLTVKKILDVQDGVSELTDEQKQNITFTVTDEHGGSVVDIYDDTVRPFTLADMGPEAAKSFELPLGTYAVTETETISGTTHQLVRRSVSVETTGDASVSDSADRANVTFVDDADTAAVTFTNRYAELISVTAVKVWDDDDNSGGTRTPVTLRLCMKVGSETEKLVAGQDKHIDADASGDDLTVSWSGLPKYDENSREITYSVKEDAVPNYTSEITRDAETGRFIVKNTYAPEDDTVSLSAKKVWDDGAIQDAAHPAVTLHLNKQTEGAAAQVVSGQDRTIAAGASGDDLTVTWNGLPKYEDGSEITYTVTEEPVAGYTGTVSGDMASGFTVTNTAAAEAETVSVSAEKVWNDNNNKDGKRAQITLRLMKMAGDGEAVAVENQEKTIAADVSGDALKVTWEDLPKKTDSGETITYSVREDNISCYTSDVSGDMERGYTVTNTYTPVSIRATKVWNDSDNQDGKRAQVTLHLNKSVENGQPQAVEGQDKTIAADASGSALTVTWDSLPKYEGSHEITYTVTEDPVAGYTTQITGDMASGYTVTNTHTAETITVSGTKTWDDGNNKDGIRPSSITVSLYANGSKVEDKTVTQSGDWKYTFTDLPKYKNGTAVTYTVDEASVPTGYTKTISGNNITNKHVPASNNAPGSGNNTTPTPSANGSQTLPDNDQNKKGNSTTTNGTTQYSPKTGGIVSNVYMFAGAGLLALTAALIILRRRRMQTGK